MTCLWNFKCSECKKLAFYSRSLRDDAYPESFGFLPIVSEQSLSNLIKVVFWDFGSYWGDGI